MAESRPPARKTDPTRRIRLTTFQTDGVFRAGRILDRYHGVVVADGVGLGKTFVAGEVIRRVKEERRRVLLVAPAALRDGTWRAFLDHHDLKVDCVSYEQLAGWPGEPETAIPGFHTPVEEYALVVVDEAHAFRNPETDRADRLRRLLQGTPQKDLMLLSATPVNNSLWDLYYLLTYFCGHDAVFADRGIPSLKDRFQQASKEDPESLKPEVLFDVLDAVAVRRTRHFVKRFYPNDRVMGPGGIEIQVKFPEPEVKSVEYRFDDVLPGFFAEFAQALMPEDGEPLLTMARFSPSRYRRRKDSEQERREVALVGLIRSALLKRFESSVHAFAKTAERMVRAHDLFLDALDRGFVATGEALAELSEAMDTGSEDALEDLLREAGSEPAANFDVPRLRAAVESDRDLMAAFGKRAASVKIEEDPILRHDPAHHARILAGPGTGKSATVVALVERYIETAPPPRLRLLTFTRAATAELAKKVLEHPGAAVERPSTIHSFAISVLLRNPGTGDFPSPLRIADDWEAENIVHTSLAYHAGVPKRHIGRLIREMASSWESLAPVVDPDVDADERARFLGAWDEHRRIYGYTLLAELPNALREALVSHPDLEGVDFDLLVVDEYQDLNACDLAVLRLIAHRGCRVIAVGDDDQSIYSFRRAHPEGIRRFLVDYPGADDYPLSVTQRCGRRIVEWAGHVIAGDPTRPAGKPPLRSKEGAPAGEVALLAFNGHASEARGIAAIVQNLVVRAGVPPSEILILLRGDHQGSFSRPIRAEIERLGIVVSDADAVKRLLSEDTNRKLVEAIRLLVNPTDSIAWASLLALVGGIGPAFFRHVYERARADGSQFGEALLKAHGEGFPGAPRNPTRRATQLINAVVAWRHAHAAPEEAPDGWGHWMIANAGGEEAPAPSEALRYLLLVLDEHSESDQDLGRFLGQILPLGKDLSTSMAEGVRIMTMAGSKGLTVRATVIGAAEEGLIPHPEADRGEERRLLYVAMTRAKEYLYVTWARRRRGPTARAGASRVNERRTHSSFLRGGPVVVQDGESFIANRWPEA